MGNFIFCVVGPTLKDTKLNSKSYKLKYILISGIRKNMKHMGNCHGIIKILASVTHCEKC